MEGSGMDVVSFRVEEVDIRHFTQFGIMGVKSPVTFLKVTFLHTLTTTYVIRSVTPVYV